ncbi:hypothetical protein Bca52824_081890 [Brassica carinata]|uniref:Uncharacterized protein n=1 Tax=Brassica carinata TaxID=52824 RepID=A0A8X7PLE6_BRACI|nr:hypothetical protein Bca52824_081890 [Brassica carinata]
MNQQKTQLFHAGVNLTESQALARYGFSKGTLPFWWDSWTPFGPLIQYLGYSGPSRLRHPLNASVAAGWLLLSWLVAPIEIWKLILLRLDPVRNLFSSWAELLSWLRQGSSAAPRTLRSVVAQAAIFHLWRQRNNVLHNQQSVPVITLFKAIDREVRNIILGRKHRRQFHNLLSIWIR